MAKNRPNNTSSKPHAGRRVARKSDSGGPAVRFRELRPMADYWGQELKRYYKLETLASAVEWCIRRQDRFIMPTVQRVLGSAPVTSLTFTLFQEGRFQLIFRLRAINAKKKSAEFGFVVAKRDGETSATAGAEHRHLEYLHARAPEWVVKPHLGGHVFLPDRHRRGEGREIYAYLTQWLAAYHELGVDKNHQFFINVHPHHLLTRAQTEALKVQIVAIVAKTYDPEKRVAMEIPEIASGDIVVTRPNRSGRQSAKLIACRRLISNVRPARLIHLIATAGGMWGDARFFLAPADPQDFFNGLALGAGAESARAWMRDYANEIARKRFPQQRHLPLDDVRALVAG